MEHYGLAATSIHVLACASPNLLSGGFVHRSHVNETGSLQKGVAFTGSDATTRMTQARTGRPDSEEGNG